MAARLETRKHHEYPVEDTVDLFLVYATATAEIFLTWADSERANHAEIFGTKGVLRLDGGSLALFDVDGTRKVEEWSVPSIADGSHHPDWFAGVVDGLLREGSESGATMASLVRGTMLRTPPNQ